MNTDNCLNRKILAVASGGGHWMQLRRICKCLEQRYSVVYVCTDNVSFMLHHGASLHVINDFNRNNFWKIIPEFIRLLKIIGEEKPDIIITTGAAPGLVSIAAGRLKGLKTIWIDSIANAAQLSCCGKVASKIANHVFTQWEYLADKKVEYHGDVMG